MAPFGPPTNYTKPDSAGLYDPRPDDDPLNINPLLEAKSMIREQTNNRAFGSVYAELQLGPGLTYRANFGPDYSQATWAATTTRGHTVRARTRAPTAPTRDSRRRRCCAIRRTSRTRSTTCCSSTRTSARRTTSKPLALYSIQKDRFTKDSLYATQLPYNTQLWYDLGSGVAGNNLSLISEWALQSYMGRINYTLLDRYTFSVTGRSDGSSRLAPGNKWAYFPSYGRRVAAGRRTVHARLRFSIS